MKTIQRREIKPKFEMSFVEKTLKDCTVKTVNLRELHGKLGNGDEFAHWIKNRIEQYDFVENQDFIVFGELPKNPKGGRPRVEYFGSITMAKELAMVENNVVGKAARKYFISCEEELFKQKPRYVERPLDLEDLGLGLLQVGIEQRIAQKRARNRWVNVLGRSIQCGHSWIQRLTNEIYQALLNCPQATARNFRQHMNLPLISADFLTRDQMAGQVQYFVSGVEYEGLRMFEADSGISFGDLRDFVLAQAKLYHLQLLRVAQGRPSDLIFNHEYNVIPILPYRERRMQTV